MSGDHYIIGDAAYLLSVRLLTPFKDANNLTDKQKNYNFVHSAARNVLERAFGIWKARF